MSKYIDAEKLKAEIDKRLMSVNLEELGNNGSHRVWAYNDVKDLITSLQQEQPEVDLEKELIQWHKCHFKKAGTYEKYSGFYLENSSQLDLARYFYKIGLNAREK